MYLSFFDLREEPFRLTPDPDFLFLSDTHKEALAALLYGVQQRKGFISLVGEVGTGKTTLLRSFLKHTDRRLIRPIYIFNPNLSFAELLANMLREPRGNTVTALLKQVQRGLLHEYRRGHIVALIIDEAQNMPLATLEGLRMLSNLETTKDKLIQIVLIGQPELQQKLTSHELRQLEQRIAVRATTRPLTPGESVDYVNHRLGRASLCDGSVFTVDALKRIVRHARGNPRLLNILCDSALVAGYGSQTRPIPVTLCNEVIADLNKARKC